MASPPLMKAAALAPNAVPIAINAGPKGNGRNASTVETTAPIQGSGLALVGLGSQWKKSFVIWPIIKPKSLFPESMPF